jgi:hypothetical protein
MVYLSGSQSGLYRSLGDGRLPRRTLRGKGALEVGPSESVVRLFTIEVTLHQTLGN